MTDDGYAYALETDTIHRRTCPGAITDAAEPVTSQEAHLRLAVGSNPCPVCLPGGYP